jgi:hypothetical protein
MVQHADQPRPGRLTEKHEADFFIQLRVYLLLHPRIDFANSTSQLMAGGNVVPNL